MDPQVIFSPLFLEPNDRFRPIAVISGIHQHAAMDSNVAALMTVLGQARELLRKHGDKWVSGRLHELETRLTRGDWTAIQSAISEATGGMGSLRDRWLSVANGDAIGRDEESQVNAKLDSLVVEVERTARTAAAALGVQLVR